MIKIEMTQELRSLLSAEQNESCVEMKDLKNGIFQFSTRHSKEPLLRMGEVVSQILTDNPDLEAIPGPAIMKTDHVVETAMLVKFFSKEDTFQEFNRKAHPVSRIMPPLC